MGHLTARMKDLSLGASLAEAMDEMKERILVHSTEVGT